MEDLSIKTMKEFGKENSIDEKEARKKMDLDSIQAFDYICFTVKKYIEQVEKKVIQQIPKELIIYEGIKSITIENVYDGKVKCTITFLKNYPKKNLRIFGMQTMTKKNSLTELQKVGLYTSEYEKNEKLPKKPNEIQAKALLSILKRVNQILKPLMNEPVIKSEYFASESYSRKKTVENPFNIQE